MREPYVESAMSVPLVHRAELQGVLNVNAPLGRSFTEYDLRALAVFAEQAALAIANARLYEAERAHVAALLELRHAGGRSADGRAPQAARPDRRGRSRHARRSCA